MTEWHFDTRLFAAAVSAYVDELGVSEEEFMSVFFGYTKSALHNWCRQNGTPSIHSILKFCNESGTDPRMFFQKGDHDV